MLTGDCLAIFVTNSSFGLYRLVLVIENTDALRFEMRLIGRTILLNSICQCDRAFKARSLSGGFLIETFK